MINCPSLIAGVWAFHFTNTFLRESVILLKYLQEVSSLKSCFIHHYFLIFFFQASFCSFTQHYTFSSRLCLLVVCAAWCGQLVHMLPPTMTEWCHQVGKKLHFTLWISKEYEKKLKNDFVNLFKILFILKINYSKIYSCKSLKNY